MVLRDLACRQSSIVVTAFTKNTGSRWVLGKARKSKVLLLHHLLQMCRLSLRNKSARQLSLKGEEGVKSQKGEEGGSILCWVMLGLLRQMAAPKNKHLFELALL